MSGRVQFVCDGAQVEVDAAPGETLLSVLRERLGVMSVKDGCAPQGQCGCCTVLVDGARAGGVRHAGRPGRGPRGHDGRRAPGRRARRASRPRSSRPADRSAASARPGSSCAPPRCGRRARRPRPASTARSPRTCAAAPAGARSSTRSTPSRPAADAGARDRDLEPRRARAELEGGVAQRVGADVAARARRASPTTPRRATRSSRCRCRPGATRRASRRRACSGSSPSRCSKRARARGQGAGPAHDGRRRARRSPLPDAARRRGAARDELGRARVPRARRVVVRARRRAGAARWRTAARSAARRRRRSPPRRASSPTARPRGADVVFSREDVVRLGPKRPPIAATRGAARRQARDRGRRRAARSARPSSLAWRTTSGSTATISIERRRRRSADVERVPRGRVRRAVRARQEGALDAAGFDRAAHLPSERAAAGVPRQRASRAAGRGAGRRPRRDRPGDRRARAGRGARRRRAIRSTRSCCARTRSAPRTWRSAGCSPKALAVDPETGEVHDLTIRSFGIIRAKDTPPIDVTIVDDPGPPRAPVVRRGVRRGRGRGVERARPRPKARGPRRSRPARRATARMLRTMTDAAVPSPSDPERAAGRGPYSAAVRAGDWLVLAGQVAARSRRPASWSTVTRAAQCRQVLANITAVLGDCGATLADVAKTTVFVTDLGDFAAVNAVYAEAFGDHKPARSTVAGRGAARSAPRSRSRHGPTAGRLVGSSSMVGVVLIVLALVLVGPIAVMPAARSGVP